MTRSGPDPDTIYVAIQGYCWEGPDGLPRPFQRGARLRGTNEAVRANPQNWLPENSDDSEIAARQIELGAPVMGLFAG